MGTSSRGAPRLPALAFLVVGAVHLVAVPAAHAATSAGVSTSPLSGNGHNVTFDGRIFVVARSDGWNLMTFRPERVESSGGWPDVSAAFSDPVLIQPLEACENALALCEPDADDTPYSCDDAGAPGGAYACYDLVVIDSNACGQLPNELRSRGLKLWIADPGTSQARLLKHQWVGARTPLTTASGQVLRGIEPTVTEDGRLLVWQGHPANDGRTDVLVYATTASACGVAGWSTVHSLSHMAHDPLVNTTYRLGERVLRAADGEPYADGALVRGAYPWLFADGSALSFTSVNMPCRAENDPVGCNARRSGFSVMGYPTNWALAHVDGPVNPSTEDDVRLFFSSPGPTVLRPATAGIDVWPFFGSNTANYTELVFDDGLDGDYAGVWHMNESVDTSGALDRTRTPDTSGYFNTGLVEFASFPARNEGPRGKTLVFNGTNSRVRVPHDVSLDPVNGLTVEMTLRPDAPVDCNGDNNWRVLLDKGGVGIGAYSLVLEEGEQLQARVLAGGVQRSVWSQASIPVGAWSTVAFTYQASTGRMSFFIDGVETSTVTYAPAPLDGFPDDLLIGGPGEFRLSCPSGRGTFAGHVEEVRLSRVDRFHDEPVVGEGEGEGQGEGEGERPEGDSGASGDGASGDATTGDATTDDATTGDATTGDGHNGDPPAPDAQGPSAGASPRVVDATPPPAPAASGCGAAPPGALAVVLLLLGRCRGRRSLRGARAA